MHRHSERTIRRLVKLLAFVVALLFDGSFKINMRIQHQTNLNDNFEGQRKNCSIKVLFKVKPARIFHILGRLSGFFKERYCLCRLMVFFFGSILSAKIGVAICFPLVSSKSVSKCTNGKSEFICSTVTLFKTKDVEMVSLRKVISVVSGPGYTDTFSFENTTISLRFHLLFTRKR